MLEAKGLKVLQETKEVDVEDDYKEGEIIEQSIEAGEKLSVGDSITLYVPKLDNKYPDFVEEDYSVSEVEEFASDYGVNLTIKYEETDEYEPGKIIKQSRLAGSTVVSGARLTITVAKEKADAPVEEEPIGDLE